MKKQNSVEERRKAISEAFHSLHQPLTGLHCGLELALLRQRSEAEYRERLQDALANAGSVLKLTRALRELVEAGDPGEQFGIANLEQVLEQVRDQIGPIAEAGSITVSFGRTEPVEIAADPAKLLRAFGGALDYVISELKPQAAIKVVTTADAATVQVKVEIAGTTREPEKGVEAQAREIRRDAAFGYFYTLGGVVESKAGIEIELPLKKAAQTSLPAARSRTMGASASRKS